ncbi:MAG: hypothetical protein FWH11_04505 [Micrococcales bacterium]|nr:hypothetical protein [Micrococcales bacterium]
MTALLVLLARYDDDTWATLANRGLLRRARKDLDSVGPAAWDDETVRVTVGEREVTMDARGPGHAVCTCPATSICQHVVAAGLWLGAQVETSEDDSGDLSAELTALDDAALAAHAGKAGWRWVVERLADTEPDEVSVNLGRVVVIELERPRVVFRYAGGGLPGLVADVPVSQPARLRALAVLALRRALGGPVPVPAPRPHSAIGRAPGETGPLRDKVRAAARGLLVDTAALGAAHLSADVAERYESVATSAQGAEYHRLARLLRRMADRVAEILARQAGADTEALLEEAAVGLALVDALGATQPEPERLVGVARAQYDEIRELDLVGLGGQVWRSRVGYRGLTLLFWWPAKRRFCSWTDARPATVRGFSPSGRWSAPGPWSGLRAPRQTAGARVRLRAAQIAGGRLSSRASTQALVTALTFDEIVATLSVVDDLASLTDRPPVSLLDAADSLRDWAVIRPAAFGEAEFDPYSQTLVWPVVDADDVVLPLHVQWTKTTARLVEALERHAAAGVPPGTLVVARVHRLGGQVVGEPLSLIRPDQPDPLEPLGFARPASGPDSADDLAPDPDDTPDDEDQSELSAPVEIPTALLDLHTWLVRTGERGAGSSGAGPLLSNLTAHLTPVRTLGFDLFPDPDPDIPAAEHLLRTLYLVRQVYLLLGALSDPAS